MTTVLDQMEQAAYTTVGVPLLVGDAVVAEARKNRDELIDRMGDRGDRFEKFFQDNELTAPEFLEEYTTKARKVATESLTDLRARLAPTTERLVEQLPDNVGEVVITSRNDFWDFLGIEAPKKAKPAAKATKTTAKKAKTTAKKRTTKASTDRKSVV